MDLFSYQGKGPITHSHTLPLHPFTHAVTMPLRNTHPGLALPQVLGQPCWVASSSIISVFQGQAIAPSLLGVHMAMLCPTFQFGAERQPDFHLLT